ncbi:MAG: ABC transporter ATP-binding protein [candidate division Zixibacteria bacterium]|nr:ABC transporter ATP-binding protein [candidate division Zixibacteria bacterium]MDH3937032.1 ABC transporter ATP-binding protein [candidate division Zixibacteria bacterium]MDH4032953.1 ABC transporter ATP-binding protein [candidate division Zixibacteria bacterium]
MIKAENLTKRFGEITAVDDISFEIHKGEAFGFLGPNGAGKSTTINMLAGVLEPDRGGISIDGATDPTRTQVRRSLGIAPQALALYDELTADENLAFFGRLYGLSGKALSARADWALELVGLTGRRRDRVKTYSGGMQRRLNLACGLVHDPQVLLLDEPTVGVDPQSRNLIFEKVSQLKAEGRTVLYTTHYMEEAERLCDRVAIIDNGRIMAVDSVENLITNHGGPSFVNAQLSAPPEETAGLPGTLDGLNLRVETDSPMDTIADLSAKGQSFVTMRIDQPNLETVFLNLTGRKLRDQ